MSKKLELNIDQSQSKLLDDIDIVGDGKSDTLGKIKSEKPVKYEPIKMRLAPKVAVRKNPQFSSNCYETWPK